MAIGAFPSSHSGISLSAMPDPIPALLERRWRGLLHLALVAAGALVFFIMFLDRFDLPDGWAFLAGGVALFAISGTSSYVQTLGRQPPVLSFLDLVFHFVWSAAKLLLVANCAWLAYEWFAGPGPNGVWGGFWDRIIHLPETIESGDANLFHLAFLWPLAMPLRDALRAASGARRFEQELAPNQERRIQSRLRRARSLIAKQRMDEADVLLTEASEMLSHLMHTSTHAGLTYHRRLLREKISELQGKAPSQAFRADPFGERGGAVATESLPVVEPVASASAAAARTAGAPDAGYGQYRDFVDSLRERSSVTWADVAGLDELVSELKTAFGMALAEAPKGVSFDPPRRILLYGPPGTGKTLLTAAVSNSFDATFYNIKVSDVLSRFFGESTRMVSAMFQIAAENCPSILFFDEIESISASRDSGGMDGEERRMISALLAELDGLKSKGAKNTLFTIAATNMPWQLDPAILSRFEKQFYVPLPDESTRQRIFEIQFDGQGFECRIPMEKMVQATRGYSGRELRRLCQEGVRLMMQEANPGMGAVVDRGKEALEKYRIHVAPITVQHINTAFRKVRPQTSPDLLRRYEEWRA
jgi:katanin p60 ATPase-containing subunit A1